MTAGERWQQGRQRPNQFAVTVSNMPTDNGHRQTDGRTDGRADAQA